MLLELALVMRYTVLAEDPAVRCQFVALMQMFGGLQPCHAEVRWLYATIAASKTYPAIVKSGDVRGVVCGCNGWFGGCAGRKVEVE